MDILYNIGFMLSCNFLCYDIGMKLSVSNRTLKTTYTLAFGYLFALALGLGFIFPDSHFPLWLEFILKATATIATLSLLIWPFAFVIAKSPDNKKLNPFKVTAYLLLAGYFLIFLEALYIKLRSCGQFDESWHCQVEGKSFVGSAILVTLIATGIGLLVGLATRLKSK